VAFGWDSIDAHFIVYITVSSSTSLCIITFLVRDTRKSLAADAYCSSAAYGPMGIACFENGMGVDQFDE